MVFCGRCGEHDDVHLQGCPSELCAGCQHERRAHPIEGTCFHYPYGPTGNLICGCSGFEPTGKPRITFRRSSTGSHAEIDIWINGANAGRLRVRLEEHALLDTVEAAIVGVLGASYSSGYVPEELETKGPA